MTIDKVEQSFSRLKAYVEKEGYKGWDPYDGLNSLVFKGLPFNRNRVVRLAWIQLFKRSPVNLRPALRVGKDFNAKGLGLFLSGYANLYSRDPQANYLERMTFLSDALKAQAISGYSGSCWGYNFDWQARAFFQPAFTPTVVATTYVAHGLLDAYDLLKQKQLLTVARSSCDFILKDLNRTYDRDGDFCFSYSPRDQTQVFNASLLGSRLLSRVYSYTKEVELQDAARKSVAFCCKSQHENGAWSYGTLPFHQWIDNFHTGFNLECLFEFQRYTGENSFRENIGKGLAYYLENFFTEEGKSKYYNGSLFPIDIHSPAQLLITLGRMNLLDKHRELLDRVIEWTIDHMQNPTGYFYYQRKRFFVTKTPYMRWAQAWMFFALSYYLKHFRK